MKFFKRNVKPIMLLAAVEIIVLICAIINLFGKMDVYEYNAADMTVTCGTLLEDGSVYVDTSQGVSGEVARYELGSLKAGVYRVELHYETDTDMKNMCQVMDYSMKHKNLLTNGTHLYSGLTNTNFDMWLKTDTDELVMAVNYSGEGSMTVKNLTIHETNALARIYLFLAVVVCVLVNVVYALVKYSRKHPFSQKTINVGLGLAGIILIASYPLMSDTILAGGDTVFHLLRIEGIKDAQL